MLKGNDLEKFRDMMRDDEWITVDSSTIYVNTEGEAFAIADISNANTVDEALSTFKDQLNDFINNSDNGYREEVFQLLYDYYEDVDDDAEEIAEELLDGIISALKDTLDELNDDTSYKIKLINTAVYNMTGKIYYAEDLKEMGYLVAQRFYEYYYGDDWNGYYPFIYGRVNKDHWEIAFEDNKIFDKPLLFVFGRPGGYGDPLDYVTSINSIDNSFENVDEIETLEEYFEEMLYIFEQNGYELDDPDDKYEYLGDGAEDNPVDFENEETGEDLHFDNWYKAEDYAFDVLDK